MPAEPLRNRADRLAFEAYTAKVGGLTHDGRTIPDWDDLNDSVRAGWLAAVTAILDATWPPRPVPNVDYAWKHRGPGPAPLHARTDNVIGCARCKASGHADLTVYPLTHPIVLADEPDKAYTEWAICPNTGEPILFYTGDEDVTTDGRHSSEWYCPIRGTCTRCGKRGGSAECAPHA